MNRAPTRPRPSLVRLAALASLSACTAAKAAPEAGVDAGLSVPEAEVAAVKPGGLVRFEVPAHPGRSFEGTVRNVGAAVREATRDLLVEAEVANADRALVPGMFAAARLLVGEAPAPVVPKSAVRVKDGKVRVFAVVDRRIEERVVKLGDDRGATVVVARGVRVGDTLVTEPADDLENGLPTE
jgi:RND family efflux transporter MFP subunit